MSESLGRSGSGGDLNANLVNDAAMAAVDGANDVLREHKIELNHDAQDRVFDAVHGVLSGLAEEADGEQ